MFRKPTRKTLNGAVETTSNVLRHTTLGNGPPFIECQDCAVLLHTDRGTCLIRDTSYSSWTLMLASAGRAKRKQFQRPHFLLTDKTKLSYLSSNTEAILLCSCFCAVFVRHKRLRRLRCRASPAHELRRANSASYYDNLFGQ